MSQTKIGTFFFKKMIKFWKHSRVNFIKNNMIQIMALLKAVPTFMLYRKKERAQF